MLLALPDEARRFLYDKWQMPSGTIEYGRPLSTEEMARVVGVEPDMVRAVDGKIINEMLIPLLSQLAEAPRGMLAFLLDPIEVAQTRWDKAWGSPSS